MQLKITNEMKVGLFTLGGIVIFVIFVFSIADIKLFAKSKDVKIIFGFANGVKISSPVRLAGIDVGQVRKTSVRFNEKTRKNEVEILARVGISTVIPRDSIVWINTLGLLGEKYIEIIPGVDYVHTLKPGDTIIGKDPIPMQEITELGRDIALKLKDSIEAINDFILNEKNREAYTEVLKNLEAASKSLSEIMEKVKSGDGSAGKFISDEAIYTDTKEFLEDIKKNPWKLMRKPEEMK